MTDHTNVEPNAEDEAQHVDDLIAWARAGHCATKIGMAAVIDAQFHAMAEYVVTHTHPGQLPMSKLARALAEVQVTAIAKALKAYAEGDR